MKLMLLEMTLLATASPPLKHRKLLERLRLVSAASRLRSSKVGVQGTRSLQLCLRCGDRLLYPGRDGGLYGNYKFKT